MTLDEIDLSRGLLLIGTMAFADLPKAVSVTLRPVNDPSFRAGGVDSVYWEIGPGHGVMMDPGSTIAKVEIFKVPGREKLRYRLVDVLPWDRVLRIQFQYPAPEETDPAAWGPEEEKPEEISMEERVKRAAQQVILDMKNEKPRRGV